MWPNVPPLPVVLNNKNVNFNERNTRVAQQWHRPWVRGGTHARTHNGWSYCVSRSRCARCWCESSRVFETQVGFISARLWALRMWQLRDSGCQQVCLLRIVLIKYGWFDMFASISQRDWTTVACEIYQRVHLTRFVYWNSKCGHLTLSAHWKELTEDALSPSATRASRDPSFEVGLFLT